jgi:hypothetical protein
MNTNETTTSASSVPSISYSDAQRPKTAREFLQADRRYTQIKRVCGETMLLERAESLELVHHAGLRTREEERIEELEKEVAHLQRVNNEKGKKLETIGVVAAIAAYAVPIVLSITHRAGVSAGIKAVKKLSVWDKVKLLVSE